MCIEYVNILVFISVYVCLSVYVCDVLLYYWSGVHLWCISHRDQNYWSRTASPQPYTFFHYLSLTAIMTYISKRPTKTCDGRDNRQTSVYLQLRSGIG